MENKELLECDRDKKILYDFSHQLNSDTQLEDQQWQEIAKKIELDPEECRLRWEFLRREFKDYVRSLKTTKGQTSLPNEPSKTIQEAISFYKNLSPQDRT